ncbi:MAG: serine/threonine protein kinase [Planctomycetaceae bacterium]|nr:serine/threonine protein kinase [Planctomycetaceae bacterium]
MSDTSLPTDKTQLDADLSGRKLGDYQLLRRLGRGGMAVVYLAEQVSLRRKVAVKVLKRHLAHDDSYIRRFHKEAQAAASLVHANIVQIHEVGQIDGIHFIVQEYVSGQNLRQYISRQGAVSVGLAVNVLRQVAAALYRAGPQGIVHRDIKPENIMLAPTGEVKVADFGLARITQDQDGTDATQVGITMGTPLYMSPEQVEGQVVDPRSDLYSLGVTAYHMLAGRPPFEGDTALSIAVQHLKKDPERLEDVRKDLPSSLCRIVHNLLAKSLESRCQSARDLLQELRSLDGEEYESYWPDDLERWDTPELLALSNSRVEATQQLDVLMKGSSRQDKSRVARIQLIAGLLLVAFVVGIFWGWLRQPGFLLEIDPARLPKVVQKETIKEQFWFASMMSNQEPLKKEALLSVRKYFPPEESKTNERYARLADQKLADLYLEQGRLTEAAGLYDSLADLPVAEQELRVFGLVGQANVHQRRKEGPQVADKLAQVRVIYETLRSSLQREVQQQMNADLRAEFVRGLRTERGSPSQGVPRSPSDQRSRPDNGQ